MTTDEHPITLQERLDSREHALRAAQEDRARLHTRVTELEQALADHEDNLTVEVESTPIVSGLPEVWRDEDGHWHDADGQFAPREACTEYLQARIGFLAAVHYQIGSEKRAVEQRARALHEALGNSVPWENELRRNPYLDLAAQPEVLREIANMTGDHQ